MFLVFISWPIFLKFALNASFVDMNIRPGRFILKCDLAAISTGESVIPRANLASVLPVHGAIINKSNIFFGPTGSASSIVVIATFVTMVGMLLKAYIPALDDALGLFIPLIVVNCLILARAESFASKNTPIKSAVDGIGMGLGFTLALTALGIVREILGNGTLFGMSLFGASYQPALLFILPPGAFLSLGFLPAGFNKLRNKKA